MKKSPLTVEITSGGQVVGHLEPSAFMKSLHNVFGSTLFLADYVKKFNDGKESCGEPERARIKLVK